MHELRMPLHMGLSAGVYVFALGWKQRCGAEGHSLCVRPPPACGCSLDGHISKDVGSTQGQDVVTGTAQGWEDFQAVRGNSMCVCSAPGQGHGSTCHRGHMGTGQACVPELQADSMGHSIPQQGGPRTQSGFGLGVLSSPAGAGPRGVQDRRPCTGALHLG